ncbi:unnamed protein product [Phytophthora lilii]|uniref:Unnamed protein product n=1 Tax=Phytophthora lilii TaxID=2077276 RepID=A0A9W6T946_9STRA|nr:unnamed protein product [Phytophthora lilii]
MAREGTFPGAQASSKTEAAKPKSELAKPKGDVSHQQGAAAAAPGATQSPESSSAPPSASLRRSRSPSAPPDTGENPRFTRRSRSRSPTDMETQVVYSGDESDAEDKVSKPTGDKSSPA